MKLLNETIKDDELKAFIKQHDDIKQAIDTYNFDYIYNAFDNNLDSNGFSYANTFTKLLFKAGINPLDYLTYIPDSYSSYNDYITTVTIPKHISEIGTFAFTGCYNLKKVKLHSKIKKIGRFAFASCYNLSSIELPAAILEIDDGTFASTGLEQIVLPEGIIKIHKEAFEGFKNLKEIRIPQSVTFIDASAFKDCSNNLKIYIPKHLKSSMYHSNRKLYNSPNTIWY